LGPIIFYYVEGLAVLLIYASAFEKLSPLIFYGTSDYLAVLIIPILSLGMLTFPTEFFPANALVFLCADPFLISFFYLGLALFSSILTVFKNFGFFIGKVGFCSIMLFTLFFLLSCLS
jgi:hypothetical protein